MTKSTLRNVKSSCSVVYNVYVSRSQLSRSLIVMDRGSCMMSILQASGLSKCQIKI